MYVFFKPAQSVGQDVHRLVERDVPEIQKINAYKKNCTDLKTTKMPWTAKQRKWSKHSLEYFDPDKEDIKAEDPSGIICQLKNNSNTLLL